MAVVAGMFAFSCVTDTTEDLGVKIEGQKGVTELAVSLEASRTHLGEKAEGLYPLYWSEGDAIAVNGVASTPLSAEKANGASAIFSIEAELTYPYCVVYPAPEAVAIEDEVTEEPTPEPTPEPELPQDTYPVTFANVQPYTVGTFAPQTAPMYGYLAEAGKIEMHHLTGILRLAIKGNGEKVTSIKIKAEKGKIAGTFLINCKTGTLTAHEEAVDTVTVTFAEPLVLGAEAAPVYVAVPAGSHGTFLVTIVTESNEKMTVKFNSDVKPINAGSVREFSEFTYEANSADEDAEVFEIDSKEALIEFARIAGTFYPRTKAVVTAEIDMTGYDWKSIEGFGAYEFDGGKEEGCFIKGLNAPLFGTTAATIKNLDLVNVDIEVTDLAISGSIACHLYGSLDNCQASGAINLNNTTHAPEKPGDSYNEIAHGGLVGMVHNGASVTDCVNNINITINSLCDASKTIKSEVGGVVGSATSATVGCTFSGLTNNGDITYASTTQKGSVYISGILGRNDDTNGQLDIAAFTNCTNNGDLSTTKESVCGGDILLAGGTGRVGMTASTTCDKFVNTGNMTHNGKCAGVRLAGVVTYNSTASFTNCSNSGDMTVNTGASATAAYLAGISSGEVTTVKIHNCTNTGDLYIGDSVAFNGFVGLSGVLHAIVGGKDGDVALQAVVTNCTNSGSLYCGNCTNEATGNGGRLYLGGVFGSINDAAVSNCVNEATGTMTAKTGDWASRYMIGAFAYVGMNNGYAETTLTDCENKAAILVDPVGAINSMQLGGATCEAYVNKANDTYSTTFTRVKNSGAITMKGAWTSSTIQIGGILGINNHDHVILNACENSGTITLEGSNGNANVGGIVGNDDNNYLFDLDGCINSGNIVYNAQAASMVRVGGMIGYRNVSKATTVENCVNTGCITIADQEYTATDKHGLLVGGIIGYNNTANLSVSDCTNGYIKNGVIDATKGAITAGKAASGVSLAGIVSYSSSAITISGSKNYGTVKQTGIGGINKNFAAYIAGVFGKCAVGSINVTNCENYGIVEYGEGLNAKDARVDVAGVVAFTQSTGNVITGCKNYGTINYKAKKTNAGEVTLSGICGRPQSETLIENCENHGLVHASGSTTSGYDIGGIIGGPSGTNVAVKSCKNYGEIRQTGVIKGSTYIGGICGYGYSTLGFDDCENHGALNIAGSATDARKTIYAGGIVGWARIPSSNGTTVQEKFFKNCTNYADLTFAGVAGTYYAGAISGIINNEDPEMYWGDISGLKNYGNITFSANATTKNYGGLIGSVAIKAGTEPVGALANITGCVFYGNITALGMAKGQIGVVLGAVARSANYTVKNSQIGGNFVFSQDEQDNDDDGEPELTDVLTPIDLTMIYKTAITEAQAKEDGCSLLTEKPAEATHTHPTK